MKTGVPLTKYCRVTRFLGLRGAFDGELTHPSFDTMHQGVPSQQPIELTLHEEPAPQILDAVNNTDPKHRPLRWNIYHCLL